jgi:cell division protein FtsI (penicillin-binding protein 3)
MSKAETRAARRRSGIAAVIVLMIIAVFVVRLFDIQVVSADALRSDAEKHGNFTGSAVLPGVRGSIVDSEGTVLAVSSVAYDAALDPALVDEVTRIDDAGNKYVESWGRLAERIGAIIDMSGAEVEKVASDALEGNLVGFLDAEEEPQEGYEQIENACLESTDGKLTYQRSGDGGVKIPGTTKEDPAPHDGGTVQLTIDSDLSWYLLQMLKEEVETQKAQAGSIMVVDVKTGEIKAAVDYPTLDPNDPAASDPEDRGALVLRRQFEPGSTFKAITAATLIDVGAVTPLTEVQASGHEVFPNGAVVGDSFNHPVYNYTVAGALIDSSNVALSKLGELVPDQTRYDYLKKFGVGEGSAIGYTYEPSGVIHTVDQWDNQTHYATSFGQGLAVTMQQVVGAYQAIANGGLKKPLHLVESCTSSDGDVTTPELPDDEQIIKEDTSKEVLDLLENVAVQGSNADAIAIPGYRIGVKTGTAQVANGQGGYKSGVYFTSMIGVAPVEDPQYVVMVSLDQPRRVTSSAANAPAFQKAMTHVLQYYRVPPSTEPFEPLPKFAE